MSDKEGVGFASADLLLQKACSGAGKEALASREKAREDAASSQSRKECELANRRGQPASALQSVKLLVSLLPILLILESSSLITAKTVSQLSAISVVARVSLSLFRSREAGV